MAWMSSGMSNEDLVSQLWRNGLIKDERVKAAFLKVDRAHYAPTSPYQDSPQPIGHAATISAPHMHAAAVEHLLPFLLPGDGGARPRAPPRVLDVGSGSGYLTHLLAELVVAGGSSSSSAPSGGAGAGAGPFVVGVEHIPALRDAAEANMRKSAGGRALLDAGRVQLVVGDGRRGWSAGNEGGAAGGWDVIHVGASAARLHEELVRQLRAPGRMFIPLDDDDEQEGGGWGGGDGGQHVWTVDKDEQGRVTKKRLFGVRYVPLTDGPKN